MGELRIIAPPDAAVGYRLAGVRTSVTDSAELAGRMVDAAIADGDGDVLAVHHRLWQAVPPRRRQRWSTSSIPLVVPLPADTGDATADRGVALRDLLVRAVGYEITFSQEGEAA